MNNLISTSTIAAIKDAMTPVALAIGKGAEYGWTVVIKQMYVEGVGFAIAAITSVCLSIFLLKKGKEFFAKGSKIKESRSYDGDGTMFLAGLFSVAGFILLALFPFFLYSSTARFINPDFYAISYLVDMVTPDHTNN